jgi:hypothetical protein
MDFLNIIEKNILSPSILFFILGIIGGILKSDLSIPESISRYLSIYLMMAIGFKGGVSIANATDLNIIMLMTIGTGLLIGFIQPFLSYGLLRLTSKLDSSTSAAVAAHYGSVSIITFATAASFLKINNIEYQGYIIAVLAMMEMPSILSALFIANRFNKRIKTDNERNFNHHIFTNGAILLLLGSFLIGWITGQDGMQKVEGFLVTPFQGMLCLFLLDMGLLATKNLDRLSDFTFGLIFFCIYMPLIGGSIGLLASYMIGLDCGTGTLFTVLCASASYIAVPAAMKLALPQAKSEIYIPMSLGITFPFNIVIGIPIYFKIAQKILG